MANLHQILAEKTRAWRETGFPHDEHPAIAELLDFQLLPSDSPAAPRARRYLRAAQIEALATHRHVSESGRERISRLQSGDELRVAIELNNPATGLALQLESKDYAMIGWAPRYLVRDLVCAVADAPEVTARVVRANRSPAPVNQRILVEFAGRWPAGYEPMDDEVFKPLCRHSPAA